MSVVIKFKNNTTATAVPLAGNFAAVNEPLYNSADGILYMKKESGEVIAFHSSADGTYVLDSDLGVANGVATLDAGGKIPSSQLNIDAMEYKGQWDASLNTPDISSGGDIGDTYRISTIGTVDLGNGAIDYFAGGIVVFNGTDWDYFEPDSQLDASEIAVLYEGLADTNKYTDADETTVGLITVTSAVDLDAIVTSLATKQENLVDSHTVHLSGAHELHVQLADVAGDRTHADLTAAGGGVPYQGTYTQAVVKGFFSYDGGYVLDTVGGSDYAIFYRDNNGTLDIIAWDNEAINLAWYAWTTDLTDISQLVEGYNVGVSPSRFPFTNTTEEVGGIQYALDALDITYSAAVASSSYLSSSIDGLFVKVVENLGSAAPGFVATSEAVKAYVDAAGTLLNSTANGEGASTVAIEDALTLFAATDVEGALAELHAAITQAATDLASTANGDGAALIGVEDAGTLFNASTVEGVLAEIQANINNIDIPDSWEMVDTSSDVDEDISATSGLRSVGGLVLDGSAGFSRVVLEGQTDPTENGIYDVDVSGNWTRAADADEDAEFIHGNTVYVRFGTHAGLTIKYTGITGPTLGSTGLTFIDQSEIPPVAEDTIGLFELEVSVEASLALADSALQDGDVLDGGTWSV